MSRRPPRNRLPNRQYIQELFFWAREKSDTEHAIEFLFRVGFDAGRKTSHSREEVAKAVSNRIAGIRKAERNRLRALRRPDPNAQREATIRSEAAPILAAVANHHGMSVRALLQRSCSHKVATIRMEACWLLRQPRNGRVMSYDDIATATERDDHTTAMHAVARVEARIAERPELRGELLGLVAGASGMRATG